EPVVRVRLHQQNHSADWPTAYTGRDHALGKLLPQVGPRRRALLRAERARNAAALLEEHARRGERAAAVHAFVWGLPHAWPSARWWWRAARALASPSRR